MAKKDTVQLTHINGATVRVDKDRAERLQAMGFSKPAARSSSSSTSK